MGWLLATGRIRWSCLLVFAVVVGMGHPGLVEPSFAKKGKPISRAVIVTPPKVDRYSNPIWNFGTSEYTNPCFIAPGAYEMPTYQARVRE